MRFGRTAAIAIVVGAAAPALAGAAAATTVTLEGTPPCTISDANPGRILNGSTPIPLPHGGESVTVELGPPPTPDGYRLVLTIFLAQGKDRIPPLLDSTSCDNLGPVPASGDFTIAIKQQTSGLRAEVLGNMGSEYCTCALE